TTGDTASGRSISALRIRLPGNSWRTSRIAAPMPNTVLATTAHTATLRVTSIACTAEGVLNAWKNGPRPWLKVRQAISPTGSTSRNSRYSNATTRKGYLATAASPPLHQVQGGQDDERDDEQRRRHGRGRGGLVALDPAVDVERGDLRLERDVAGDQDGRAEL